MALGGAAWRNETRAWRRAMLKMPRPNTIVDNVIVVLSLTCLAVFCYLSSMIETNVAGIQCKLTFQSWFVSSLELLFWHGIHLFIVNPEGSMVQQYSTRNFTTHVLDSPLCTA